MKIAIHLAHPAHFHMFRIVIGNLTKNHDVLVTYNEKDVLENLVNNSELKSLSKKINAPKGSGSKIDLIKQFGKKNIGLYKVLKEFNPEIIIGTSIIIAWVGRLLNTKSIIVNEDDFDIVIKTAQIGYPFATTILCPLVCRTAKWEAKCVKYNGYHELAYLRPEHFTPDRDKIKSFHTGDQPYFLIRFAELTAHHDEGIKGINTELAKKLIDILSPKGSVYITSEKKLDADLEAYKIQIDPLDMHHAMFFANMYIGDSQTMAAEAAVLGTPALRFNDFVGRLSYLEELEYKWQLTIGIKTDDQSRLLDLAEQLSQSSDLKADWAVKRDLMLAGTIDVALFWTSFFENYPNSIAQYKDELNNL